MSTVTLKKIFVEKQKQTCERLTRCGGATSSYNKKKKKKFKGSVIFTIGMDPLPCP